ncbi:non-ribosomal peptide synthetase [Paenibacillus massiliensis]|uniref:non-ribosomal peptide synthetase n=1 Tax=Paenibacillus massiliensis TaxID=225917 RepID=UPI00046FDE7B|nr:non-ribosomal peptide synthetase [Paenibacillus massiliensis]
MDNTIQYELARAFAAFPERKAIECGQQTLSYKELDAESDRICELLHAHGAAQYDHIGILMQDRCASIAAVIGILKLGGVFVPLDPLHPDERLVTMLDTAEVSCLLCDDAQFERAETLQGHEGKYFVLRARQAMSVQAGSKKAYSHSANATDPIYIYFTSGSTGKPKAVVGKNESLLHFMNWEASWLDLTDPMRVSQLTSIGFDAVLRDIFVPICAGGTICIPESREIILDPLRLVHWLEHSRVHVVHCTPSLFRFINHLSLTADSYPDLRYVLLAGETIRPESLKNWYDNLGNRVRLVNLYGPTETTMIKLFYPIKPEDVHRESIPIGRPLPDTSVYLLDEQQQPVSGSEAGEICIATRYMTHGYFPSSHPDQTAFIPDPCRDQSGEIMMYRTGDMGRWLPEGELALLGRKDNQVKIRGNRVELGDIEHRLTNMAGIREAVVRMRAKADTPKGMAQQHCAACGLPSTYPGISFDDMGKCSVCTGQEQYRSAAEQYFQGMEQLQSKLQPVEKENQPSYDCLLLYSGGKDSTYALYRLVEMGARVLAYTFDNGYISSAAFRNIDSVVKELGVDHIVGTFDGMLDIFKEGLKQECSVCNGCFKAMRILSTRVAAERGIPYIVTGLSRGQIYDVRLYDILQQGYRTTAEIELKIQEQRVLYHGKKDYVAEAFERDELINRSMLDQVELVDFYRYCDVSKQDILSFLQSKSECWSNPEDTGFCSSNCLINDAGIYVQRTQLGYDNYAFPNSWEVRTGHITLEQSRNELESPVNEERVQVILKELGYDVQLQVEEAQEPLLIAYYLADKMIDDEKLSVYLRRFLPDYMIPARFIRLDKMPLTPNGKLDYNALPSPFEQDTTARIYKAPNSSTELKLLDIWTHILGIKRISADDHFLQIGVHSLNIMTLIAQVYENFQVELPLEQVFEHDTLEEIAAYIDEQDSQYGVRIEPAAKQAYYPLTAAQMRVFMDEQLVNTGSGYHITTAFMIYGPIDVTRLERACGQLIERHEALRTSFDIVDGDPVQRIHEHCDFHLEIVHLQGQQLHTAVNGCIRPFQLERAPLIRSILIPLAEEQHLLVLDMHHIVADGKSVFLLQRDLAALYEGRELHDLPVQYVDFAQWQTSAPVVEDLRRQEQFWQSMFADYRPLPGIPTDHTPEANERSFAGGHITWEPDPVLSRRLYAVAAEQQTTLFMVLLAAFHVLYAKYSAREEVTVGTPVEGRRRAEVRQVVGMFVNALAIRSYPEGDKPFSSFLQEIRGTMLQAYEHQDYPLERLAKQLDLHHSRDHLMFDTVFSMLNYEDFAVRSDDLQFEYAELPTLSEIYNLRVEIVESPERLRGTFKYGQELYEARTVSQLAQDYERILAAVAEFPNIKLKDIEIRTPQYDEIPKVFADIGFNF